MIFLDKSRLFLDLAMRCWDTGDYVNAMSRAYYAVFNYIGLTGKRNKIHRKFTKQLHGDTKQAEILIKWMDDWSDLREHADYPRKYSSMQEYKILFEEEFNRLVRWLKEQQSQQLETYDNVKKIDKGAKNAIYLQKLKLEEQKE